MIESHNDINKHLEMIKTAAEAIIDKVNTNAPKVLDNIVHLLELVADIQYYEAELIKEKKKFPFTYHLGVETQISTAKEELELLVSQKNIPFNVYVKNDRLSDFITIGTNRVNLNDCDIEATLNGLKNGIENTTGQERQDIGELYRYILQWSMQDLLENVAGN